jgi:hypothetical protein
VIGEWLTNGRRHPSAVGGFPELSINELILRYLAFARDYYQRDGQPTDETAKFREALRPLHRLYGLTSATDFGPLALKTVRQAMIDSGLCRTTINY